MKKVLELSAKLKSLDTKTLESMACGLRSMRKGQKSLLKLIEQEIARRKAAPHPGVVRAERREKRRQNMSPAEKEWFDPGERYWSDLTAAKRRR